MCAGNREGKMERRERGGRGKREGEERERGRKKERKERERKGDCVYVHVCVCTLVPNYVKGRKKEMSLKIQSIGFGWSSLLL